MVYHELWQELKWKIAEAENSLLAIRNSGGATPTEKKRLDAKLEGV